MPIYELECASCGRNWEELLPIGSVSRCDCGGMGKRLMPSQLAVVIPAYMQAGHDDSRYKAWLKSDNVQSRLKSGELEMRKKEDDY